MTYEMHVAGLTRQLPLCPISDKLMIGAFVIFGDVELTCACAAGLLKIAPEFDYMVAPEAKAIPLVHEMARQSGRNEYFLVRKAPKLYMDGVFEAVDRSITTAGEQKLYMDGADARKMKGKRILILDDVISTGGGRSAGGGRGGPAGPPGRGGPRPPGRHPLPGEAAPVRLRREAAGITGKRRGDPALFPAAQPVVDRPGKADHCAPAAIRV